MVQHCFLLMLLASSCGPLQSLAPCSMRRQRLQVPGDGFKHRMVSSIRDPAVSLQLAARRVEEMDMTGSHVEPLSSSREGKVSYLESWLRKVLQSVRMTTASPSTATPICPSLRIRLSWLVLVSFSAEKSQAVIVIPERRIKISGCQAL